jgi:hypothetical protein
LRLLLGSSTLDPKEYRMPTPRDNLKQRLSRCRQIKISVIERKSGKTISIPVGFVLKRDKLYLLPAQGSEPQWHKNVPQNPTIRIDARGVGAEFRAVRAMVRGRLAWTADAAFRAISESRGCSIPDTLEQEEWVQNFVHKTFE